MVKSGFFVVTFSCVLGFVSCVNIDKKESFFTRQQALDKVGHKVECVYTSQNDAIVKCPEIEGQCSPVKTGDRGIVIGTDPGENDRYGVKIQWMENEKPTPFYTYSYGEDSSKLKFK